MLGKNWTPADLFALSTAAQSYCVLKTAVELDLFTLLDRDDIDGMTVQEIAHLTNWDKRALNMLVTAMISLDLLERRDDRLVPTEPARQFLSSKAEGYYGFIIKHIGDIMPDWLKLTSCVKSGLPSRLTMTDDNEQERENFLMGMFNVARGQADAVAKALDLSGRKRLLDIGGGPGAYSIYFCQNYPQLQAILFDLPTSEKIARGNIESYGLGNRISFYGGDYLKDELPGGIDAAWISQVLHGESPINCRELVRRAAERLEPGGLLGIQEFLLNEDRNGPPESALFALNMLVETPEGQTYTEAEIVDMMEAAGCVSIRRLKAEVPPNCGILVGFKK
mgnify:CR=1 FL=1